MANCSGDSHGTAGGCGRGHGPSSDCGARALLLRGRHAQASADETPSCVVGVKVTGLGRNTATPGVFSGPPDMSQRAGLTRAASDSRFSRSRDLPSSQSTDPKRHGATPHVSGWRRTQTQAWGVPELPLRPPRPPEVAPGAPMAPTLSSSSMASPVKYSTARGTIRSRKKCPISKSEAKVNSESSS